MSTLQNALTANSQPPQSTSLNHLPDDILLRIIHLTGGPGTQLGIAYKLAAVSARLRRLLDTQFLTSITHLSHDWISSLSLSDATAARQSLTSMFSRTPSVRELLFNGCSPVLLSRICFTSLAQSACNSLVTVNLAYCRLTDDVVRPLLRCSKLRNLILQRCEGLTGTLFQDRSFQAPLEFLDLSWVHTLTADGVEAIANVVTLKELLLKGCEAVNTFSIRAFIKSDIRKSLTSISLAYCPLLQRCLFDLLESTPNLATLILAEFTGNIWMSGDFPEAGIDELKSTYPAVQIMFVT